MITYVEEYRILNIRCGIEDKDSNNPSIILDRLHIWFGGCGIGSADTLPNARSILYGHIQALIARRTREHEDALLPLRAAGNLLGMSDPFQLGRFLVTKVGMKP